MSVLLYDPAKKNHVLLLNEGAWAGRRWSVCVFATIPAADVSMSTSIAFRMIERSALVSHL
jgi:hypothetical protein